MMRFAVLALCLVLLPACGSPEQPRGELELRVAVASNFLSTLKQLAEAYNLEQPERAVKIQTLAGSTGLLYAQIDAGAPFDLFFAADVQRPQKLRDSGKVVGEVHVYALGRLALWVPDPGYQDAVKRLREGEYKHLVIANPDLAPYGAAAREVLSELRLWDGLTGKLIRGENVAQAYQYLHSRRAELGFVALSQVVQKEQTTSTESVWEVPARMHEPLAQAAVLLPGQKQAEAEAFLSFCLGKQGRAIIEAAGYDLPDLY